MVWCTDHVYEDLRQGLPTLYASYHPTGYLRIVTRSKHTDPRAVRATRRLGSPRAHRSEGDTGQRRRVGRALKEAGNPHSFEKDRQHHAAVWPRIIVSRPSPGFFHPAPRMQVQEILEAIGPTAVYGLKSVELSRRSDADRARPWLLARYVAPDRVMLFEQQLPPWRFVGRLASSDRELFESSGAEVSWSGDAQATVVDWPGDTLSNFMLFEGLLHEIGHHIMQHEARAGTRRIARTKDHEAFASAFATRYKRELLVGRNSE